MQRTGSSACFSPLVTSVPVTGCCFPSHLRNCHDTATFCSWNLFCWARVLCVKWDSVWVGLLPFLQDTSASCLDLPAPHPLTPPPTRKQCSLPRDRPLLCHLCRFLSRSGSCPSLCSRLRGSHCSKDLKKKKKKGNP